MLNELGRALMQAISTSSEVNGTARKIRQEGYSVYLALDCKQDRERSTRQIELTPRKDPSPAPEFRLDGNDVAWLKSLGIDATRPAPRRRSAHSRS